MINGYFCKCSQVGTPIVVGAHALIGTPVLVGILIGVSVHIVIVHTASAAQWKMYSFKKMYVRFRFTSLA